MKKRIGRPYAENPKDYMFRMRMDTETLKKLDDLCEKCKLSRSEMVRQLIKKAK
ncbi:ribbon-helix-helix protein, CopG family [Eubacterium sp. AM28-8LB]|uniref:ribbon-helix-helix protein, CopG family n=1 Tax=Longicatena caecimuris TaxID=1796635 RepID=UPI000E7230F5|nr:ribbon-helix-helix protein, CopG family [Longicatena caecimuris]RJV77469.1 ribbon-helix-helix protein, CopG family [Eubacterium sp. AM47-9]RJW04544.1 ribbon-helix-helix protein, CopG family [Eubacterium sp. AM28-8LB]